MFLSGSADYESTTQDLVFTASTTRHVVEIPIVDDTVTESIENFFAQLTVIQSDADVQLAPDQTTIEITDDDSMFVHINTHAHTHTQHMLNTLVGFLLL